MGFSPALAHPSTTFCSVLSRNSLQVRDGTGGGSDGLMQRKLAIHGTRTVGRWNCGSEQTFSRGSWGGRANGISVQMGVSRPYYQLSASETKDNITKKLLETVDICEKRQRLGRNRSLSNRL
jgi:hypothetical protein